MVTRHIQVTFKFKPMKFINSIYKDLYKKDYIRLFNNINFYNSRDILTMKCTEIRI